MAKRDDQVDDKKADFIGPELRELMKQTEVARAKEDAFADARREKGLPPYRTPNELTVLEIMRSRKAAGGPLVLLGCGLLYWPLYRLSLLRQVHFQAARQGRAPAAWPGYAGVARHIVQTEGVKGLWRGVGLETVGRLVMGNHLYVGLPMPLLGLAPLSAVNVRFASDLRASPADGHRYKSWLSVVREMKRGSSWAQLFVNLHRGAVSLSVGTVAWFMCYRPHLSPSEAATFASLPDSALAWDNLVPATLDSAPSFALATLVTYPLLVMRNRMVVSVAEEQPVTSARAMLRQSINNDGFLSLFRGFGMHVAATSLLFLTCQLGFKLFDPPSIDETLYPLG